MITSGVVCREFVGRAIELDFLVEQALRVEPARGATMLVDGEAGIGKSRLIREFVQVCAKRGLRAVSATCPEFGAEPYAPILALAEGLGLDALVEILSSDDAAGGASLRRERDRRFHESASAFAGAARVAPFIAVLEDLHWADPATLELFHHLTLALANHAIVFVGSERTDDVRRDGAAIRLLAAIKHDAGATLTLNALGPEETKALIVAAARDDGRRLSAVVVDEIAELSDGRPFFAEELLRSALDRGPQQTDGRITVPHSLRAAVRERLAEFSDFERRVLAHAAVIGREFSLPLLAELLETGDGSLLPILRNARRAQLIVENDTANGFLFRHALTREVIYEEILRSEARRLHQRLALRLIERAPKTELSAIAYHAWRSGDALLSQTWNTRAGERAEAICAHGAAINSYDRAYHAAVPRDARAALAARIASAYYAIGELADASSWYEIAAGEAARGADPDAAHRCSLERARSLFESGDYEHGIDVSRAVAAALAGRDDPLRFQAETMTASLLGAAGRAAEGLMHLEAATALTCNPEPAWAARHAAVRAQTLHALGRIEESAGAFQQAESAARALDDRSLLVRTLYNHSHLQMSCGELADAVQLLEAGLAVAREMQSHLVAWLLENLAYCHLLLGNLERARAAHAQASQIDPGTETVRVYLAAIGARLGTLTGDDGLVEQSGIERIARKVLERGSDFTVAAAIGSLILWQQAHGTSDAGLALAAVERLECVRDALWDVLWFSEAAAGFAVPLAERARAALAGSSAAAPARVVQAGLTLLDARIAARERRRDDARLLAEQAVEQFKALGWPVEEAYARALRGGVREAVEILRRIGAHGEAARIVNLDQRAPHRRGEGTLTAREREIAMLIAASKTNREVAQSLVISERTVETHVASIYNKLGVTNRRDLSALLRPSEGSGSAR